MLVWYSAGTSSYTCGVWACTEDGAETASLRRQRGDLTELAYTVGGGLSIELSQRVSSTDASKKLHSPPRIHTAPVPVRYRYRKPAHCAYSDLSIIVSTAVVVSTSSSASCVFAWSGAELSSSSVATGNMKPACVMYRADRAKWYADSSSTSAVEPNCSSTRTSNSERSSCHRKPTTNVKSESIVEAQKVFAVIALRSVCTAYNQPFVSRTCSAHCLREVARMDLHDGRPMRSRRSKMMWYNTSTPTPATAAEPRAVALDASADAEKGSLLQRGSRSDILGKLARIARSGAARPIR
mmetsp:Transcript_21516/g.46292  ORF Transcript_21516/g.46292 Transcript_21516/m.46292 type:complete len:296 (+) Transcript_21516:183-1070(+)